MDNETLLMKLDRIHNIADILLDLLVGDPRLQTLTELIIETSTMPEA